MHANPIVRAVVLSLVALALWISCPARARAEVAPAVGIDERLGESIPPDIAFTDSSGRSVTMGEIVNAPTVLSLVFFGCRHICPLMLAGEAEVIGKLEGLAPGRDYRLLTVSFDPSDTPEIAARAKGEYLRAIGRPFPEAEWLFLTGTPESIAALTSAVGFRYTETEEGFSHTAALIALSSEGRIMRYLYGVTYLPFDLKLAISEAAEGRTGSAARKVLLYCFSYDSEAKRYALNLLRIVGSVTLACIVLLFIYLMRQGRKRDEEIRGRDA